MESMFLLNIICLLSLIIIHVIQIIILGLTQILCHSLLKQLVMLVNIYKMLSDGKLPVAFSCVKTIPVKDKLDIYKEQA